jgi:hypothetical protein
MWRREPMRRFETGNELRGVFLLPEGSCRNVILRP